MVRSRVLVAVAMTTALVLSAIATATAHDAAAGFQTAHPSMLTPVRAGVEVTPLLTVGDVLPSGYRFEAIPDGIALRPRGQGRVDLYVNHETSKVPFPYNAAPRPRPTARTTSTTPRSAS